MYINNILKDGELDNSTFKENLTVWFEGNREGKRNVKIYNLDIYIDGNKRLSDSALVAITILISESKQEEKEVIIDLIMNFLIM